MNELVARSFVGGKGKFMCSLARDLASCWPVGTVGRAVKNDRFRTHMNRNLLFRRDFLSFCGFSTIKLYANS